MAEEPVERKEFSVGDRVVIPIYNKPDFRFGKVVEVSRDSSGVAKFYLVARRDGVVMHMEFHELEAFVPKVMVLIHNGVPIELRTNDPGIEVVLYQTDSEDPPESVKEDDEELRLARIEHPYLSPEYQT